MAYRVEPAGSGEDRDAEEFVQTRDSGIVRDEGARRESPLPQRKRYGEVATARRRACLSALRWRSGPSDALR